MGGAPGGLKVAEALELVQIDHTLVDVLLVDDAGQLIGRPWLTLAMDVATRVVRGWYLSMDAPSSISVALCLAHAMQPKPENAGHVDRWPMYGVPRRILVDNGKDLRSLAFKRGCEQHGIALSWRPVREPHYGAHIERLMGTFMRMVHELPGTTFSNARQRGDYPSEKRACLTLADLRTWFIEKICHGYHVRTHRALGCPPLVAWERAFKDGEGRYQPPEVAMDAHTLRRDFFPFEFRRLTRTGVHFRQTVYWHPALTALVGPQTQVMVH
jgi:putative transposase